MLEKYMRHHRGVWSEVEQGLRRHGMYLILWLGVLPLLVLAISLLTVRVTAGVQLLSIHQPKDGSNELCMFVETDAGCDMGRDLGPKSRYRSVPRVRLWEETMCTYFEGGNWEEVRVHTHTHTQRTQRTHATHARTHARTHACTRTSPFSCECCSVCSWMSYTLSRQPHRRIHSLQCCHNAG
jgi:hypothetical protein